MKNLLFFLWMLFAPIVEDMANFIVWKTKQLPMPSNHYENTAFASLIFYFSIAYLLYEN